MTDAYYLPAGEGRYRPTEATSPWDEGSQHGGPPAALLATAIEQATGAPGLRLARLTSEMLGPIPRRELTVTAQTVRPGRRVAMTDAVMAVDGRPVVLARAWHIATGATPPAPAGKEGRPPAVEPIPEEQPPAYFPGMGPGWGYGQATEWRYTQGGFSTLGPARVWTRVRIPLIAGEELTGYQRALIVADAANGLSSELPFTEWSFIPPSVTVHFQRHPVGEWVHLTARTRMGSDGVGLTTGMLGDQDGTVGTVEQPLLISPV